jgi:long-chain acyl-CoA synthetase
MRSYDELGRRTRDFAAYLQQRKHMRPGDRIAIILPNLLQYPIALFGALRAGLVAVNCNPLFTAKEFEYQLKDSGATAVVVLENLAHTVQEVVGKTAVRTVIVTRVGGLFPPVRAWATNLVVRYARRMVTPWQIDGAVDFQYRSQGGRETRPRAGPVVRG